jgi:hypothetical protein
MKDSRNRPQTPYSQTGNITLKNPSLQRVNKTPIAIPTITYPTTDYTTLVEPLIGIFPEKEYALYAGKKVVGRQNTRRTSTMSTSTGIDQGTTTTTRNPNYNNILQPLIRSQKRPLKLVPKTNT